MYYDNSESSDTIETLPTDASIPSQSELMLMDTLFQKKLNFFEKFLLESNDLILIGGLYLVFEQSFINDLLHKFIPMTEKSVYIELLIRTLLFVGVYFILKNLHLVKKS